MDKDMQLYMEIAVKASAKDGEEECFALTSVTPELPFYTKVKSTLIMIPSCFLGFLLFSQLLRLYIHFLLKYEDMYTIEILLVTAFISSVIPLHIIALRKKWILFRLKQEPIPSIVILYTTLIASIPYTLFSIWPVLDEVILSLITSIGMLIFKATVRGAVKKNQE
jgi:hypothetical protein